MDGHDRSAVCLCFLGWPRAGTYPRRSPTIATGQRRGIVPSAVHRRSVQPGMRRSPEFYERYLTHHIRFDLDEAAQAGLRLFYQLAHRHGLIDAVAAAALLSSSTKEGRDGSLAGHCGVRPHDQILPQRLCANPSPLAVPCWPRLTRASPPLRSAGLRWRWWGRAARAMGF